MGRSPQKENFGNRLDEELLQGSSLSTDGLSRDALHQSLTGFRSTSVPVIFGLLLRLLLAPFTSLQPDVAVWWQATDNAMHGLGLYQLPGFSYPPLYGYWTLAVGGIAHIFGVAPHALGGLSDRYSFLGKFSIGSIVTTPWGTLIFKIPMIVSDLGTGWCVWRIALKMGGSERQARRAFYWWFFNPLVIFVSSVHGQIDSLAALGIAAAILATTSGVLGARGSCHRIWNRRQVDARFSTISYRRLYLRSAIEGSTATAPKIRPGWAHYGVGHLRTHHRQWLYPKRIHP